MSSPTLRIAAMLLAVPLLAACVGEEGDARVDFPRNVGTDDPQEASQGGVPELPGQEQALGDMEGQPMPGYPDDTEPPSDGYPDDDPSALTDFHGALDAHGQWLEDPDYGTMWQPSPSEVGTDFAPYLSGGHWGYGDSNYVWVSDYGWGWAPFHYGRWTYGAYGWGWIPGRTYAPSWTTWRTGPAGFGYVGWAPLPPAWYWGAGGVATSLARIPAAPYAFVGTGELFSPTGLSSRVVTAPGALQTIAAQTHAYAPPATVATGGRVAASPTVGPSPQALRIPSAQVNHVAATNPQLARAQQFAHPASAMALGAHGLAVGGRLGPLSPSASRAPLPGGAVAGHPQITSRSMTSYGGSSHTYYNNRSSTQLGSSYGHGGSMRSYGAPSGTHLSGGAYHPTAQPAYQPSEGTSVPQPSGGNASSSHFGGHYGASSAGHGGGHR